MIRFRYQQKRIFLGIVPDFRDLDQNFFGNLDFFSYYFRQSAIFIILGFPLAEFEYCCFYGFQKCLCCILLYFDTSKQYLLHKLTFRWSQPPNAIFVKWDDKKYLAIIFLNYYERHCNFTLLAIQSRDGMGSRGPLD